MAKKGYIRLHRQIQDCWVWSADDKYDKAHAFIDLLLSANHADKKIAINGNPTIIHRGQLFTSKMKLSLRWNWNVKTVTKFLNALKMDSTIEIKTSSVGITITIVNYDIYQASMDSQTDSEMDSGMDGTVDSSMENTMDNGMDSGMDNGMDTNNKCNNNDKRIIKNDKECKKNVPKNVPSKEPEVFYPTDEVLDATFKEYIKFRKQTKAPLTEHGIELAMKKLEKLSSGDNDLAIEILNQSIINGWKGLFEVKSQTQKKSNVEEWAEAGMSNSLTEGWM